MSGDRPFQGVLRGLTRPLQILDEWGITFSKVSNGGAFRPPPLLKKKWGITFSKVSREGFPALPHFFWGGDHPYQGVL